MFPLDIACRASNLTEREQLVTALTARYATPTCTLSAFDRWKIDSLAEKLAGYMEPQRKAELVALLSTYKRFELGLPALEEPAHALFAKAHRAWLPTYQQALEIYDHASVQQRDPDIAYGRFARACEPFLHYLHRELASARHRANTLSGCEFFSSQLLDDLQLHLLGRFELPLAWAIETDAKVYCARSGINRTSTTADDYISYLNVTFSDRDAYHRFYLRFPTLGRWLAQITRFVLDNGCMLIERLTRDREALSACFSGTPIRRILSVQPGKSDYHNGGQSVTTVHVELEDGTPGTLLYKPRCVRSEVALAQLQKHLATRGVIPFATYLTIARDGYGYAAMIPPHRNHVTSLEQAAQIYEETGGYLGLFHILGGSDIHLENLLVADGHAFICDGETILGVLPCGQEQPAGSLLDSVYKTGLLEWPRTDSTDMKLSGVAGGKPFQLPYAQPRISTQRPSLALSVSSEVGLHVDPTAANRVYFEGQLVEPEAFQENILRGFDRVHTWFQQHPEEAIRVLTRLFADASVRFISWSTQIYMQLLLAASHPSCLMEPLEVDLIFASLRHHPRKWDHGGAMADREQASLWRLDIPIFTVRAQERTLVHDQQTPLPQPLELSPLEYATQRIKHLTPENRLRQRHYIRASLSTAEVQNPSFVASALDYARQIGEQLCMHLRPPTASAPWTSYRLTREGLAEVDISTELYNGSAGIALFLAYLDAIEPRPAFRTTAERALDHAITRRDPSQPGAFQGTGGLIYLLTHLAHLWQRPDLLVLATRLSRELAALIEQDRAFDVLGGTAGLIPVLIGLAQATTDEPLKLVQHCVRHLLQHAEHQGDTLSWPSPHPEEAKANLTGFAHGASGIGWALILAGCAIGQPEAIEAGRQAFAYEALHFDPEEQDWYDLRTRGITPNKKGLHFANAWCNGAAGIGLSRIACWSLLGDDHLLHEASLALAATLRNFHKLSNDTLCHGRSGNAELFLRFACLKQEPAFRVEANVQAQSQWRSFEKARSWLFGGANVDVFPGLMLGLAGFGMHFLRLAYPERVPSPLLLDSPQLERK